MRTILLSTAAVVALVAAAHPVSAADIRRNRPVAKETVIAPPPPVTIYNWSGVYIGLNGGWAWGRSEFDFAGAGLGSNSFRVDGGLIGGTVGYNLQLGPAVFGIEGDLDWVDIKGSGFCAGGICETRSRWLGTARGRIGIALDRFMPYLTGGAAFGNLRASIPTVGATTDTRTGWTVGGGGEFALSRNWSVKAEYLHVDLGKFDCGIACGAPVPTHVDFKTNIIRAGVNYRF